MVTLAALLVGVTLTAAGPADPPVVNPLEPPVLTPREQRAERHRRRMATIHTVGGVALEVGAGLFHLLTASAVIGDDPSCVGDECHRGSPVLVLLPATAIAMGWIGATRLAAGREASIWRSPVFWVGTAVTIVTLPAAVAATYAFQSDRHQRVAGGTTLVAGFVLGNVIQVWGAFTAPPREPPVGPRELSVAPGCAPTAGGIACGLALAGF